MINKFWRVTVTIPEKIWRELGHTSTYDRASIEATKGNLAAGMHSYSEVTEWAEFGTLDEAYACEKRLNDMIKHFQEKLK